MTIPVQQVDTSIVKENGKMEAQFQFWVSEMTKLSPIIGSGTPEGNIEADQYRVYVDEAVPLTPVTYRKMLPDIGGDKKQGWAVT